MAAHEAEHALGAYALGALDPDERLQVEQHLESCDSCRAALAQYELIAGGLLHAAPSRTPGPALRASLIARLAPSQAGPRRPTWWRAVTPRLAVGLGVALLIVANLALLFQTRSLIQAEQATQELQRAGQAALAISSYPNAEVALIEQDPIRGTFVYDPDLPVAILYVWGLNPPPADRAYQAWLIETDGSRVDGGLVRYSEDGLAWLMIQAPTRIGEFTGFGITIEPKQGSPAPTGERVIGADL